ncbi:MAG TPA: DegT/DnrJ/EryC1/StrS family aminotransferase [Anaerolineae bacterium]|nr:DegT/DnrJ/EryC1/StrS family aminotransferase [Anaerolineae bacterium]
MSGPDLTDAEREAVAKVLHTPRLSTGPQVEAFEATVAERVGAKHAIAVNSGTAGLHLCVHAVGITDGDWVITTPFSFIASSNVLLYERAIPVFVDVDPLTGNIDPVLVAEAAADLTEGGAAVRRWLPAHGASIKGELKAILTVDVFGQPADYDPLVGTASRYGLRTIEDSCEALGAVYKDRPAGMLGDIGVFAFYPNKQITTGEGGIVVTNHDDWANMVRALRNQGRAPGDTWLEHSYLGYNYRMDEMCAALGKVQMSRLDELLEKRERVVRWYGERLKEIPGIELHRLIPSTTRMSWFVYVIRLDPTIERRGVMERLETRGVPSRPYFIPIHLQPHYVERFGYQLGQYPVTEDLGQRSLALPFSGVMTETEVEYVCEALKHSLG